MATILIVDDDPTNRELLVTLLGRQGHHLLEAADGAEALDRARTERPNLIISDILMPVLDGFDLVRQLRAEPALAQIPVVFHTSQYLEQEMQALAQACGVTHILAKPNNPAVVLSTVETALTSPLLSPSSPPTEEFERRRQHLIINKLWQKVRELEHEVAERKQAEAALRHSEERFAKAFRASPDALIISQQADGKILEVNDSWEVLFGYSREEAIDHTPLELNLFVNPAARQQAINQLHRAGSVRDFELEIRCKSGRVRQASLSTETIVINETPNLLTILRDITAWKQTKEQSRLLMEAALHAIILVSQDGKIHLVNTRAEELFGYSREALIGQPVEMLVPESFRVQHRHDREAFLNMPTTRPMGAGRDLFGLRKDGSTVPLEIGLNPIDTPEGTFILASIIDITERKQAEESLRRYTERLRNLHEIDVAILAAQSSTMIIQNTLKRLRQLVPYQLAKVTLFDFEKYEAIVFSADMSQDSQKQAGLRLPLEPDWIETLRLSGPLVVDDTLALSQPPSLARNLTAEGIRSYIALPLLTGEELLGVINLASSHPGAFKSETVEIVEEVASQLAVALQQAHLHEQVSQARKRLEVLSRRLLEAQETERRHIARELHDEIGQNLSMIKIDLQTLQHLPQASALASHFDESIAIVDLVLQQVRALSVELRPSLLDDLGLVPALRWYIDRQAQRGGFTASFKAAPLVGRLTSELETVCYRLAQEALTNIVRHAKARKVEVELQQYKSELWLVIQDDGIGFDVQLALKQIMQGASLGLLSMEERISLVGGQLEIESILQQGTMIRARLPLKYAPPVKLD